MPKIEYHAPVNAELQTIWEVLMHRIEHPDVYQEGVESFSFPENTEDYAVREVVMGGFPLKERITIDEEQGEVRYQLLDHPLFAGSVYNALIPPAEGDLKAKPVVQFRMDWEPLSEEAEAMEREARPALEESLKQAVHYVRDLAQHRHMQALKAAKTER